MFWVIQDSFYSADGHSRLLAALERLEIAYQVVKLNPQAKSIAPDVNPEGAVWVCGSSTMCGLAGARGWKPGSFLNDNFRFEVWGERYRQILLNADAALFKIRDIPSGYAEFFMRAPDDSKAVPGRTWKWGEFVAWREALAAEAKPKPFGPTLDSMVVVANAKTIHYERRYFVIDGELVASSQYRAGGRAEFSAYPDDEANAFVSRVIADFSPARAFVLDVAGTPDGLRVVEINCINSAAFYACDVPKLVAAIERLA